MADDSLKWIAGHIQSGVNLREEVWPLRTHEEADAWKVREQRWAKEARDGIAARKPSDVARVETLDEIYPLALPVGHPWAEPPILGMAVSSTGVGRPGNNPLSCHAARIKEMKKIESEWRDALPQRPKLAKAGRGDVAEFDTWYAKRAGAAKKQDRSSREEDHEAAEKYFRRSIPNKWVIDARTTLPADHPFRARGRRPNN